MGKNTRILTLKPVPGSIPDTILIPSAPDMEDANGDRPLALCDQGQEESARLIQFLLTRYTRARGRFLLHSVRKGIIIAR